MTDDTSTSEIIESLVRLEHGDSDARTQQLYRQNLQALVELAKLEQSRERMDDIEPETSHRGLHTVH